MCNMCVVSMINMIEAFPAGIVYRARAFYENENSCAIL